MSERPRPPEVLADALQDRIHPASGRLVEAVPIRDRYVAKLTAELDALAAHVAKLDAKLARESRARRALELGLERIAATRWKRVDSAEVALMAREIIAGQWQSESDGTAQMEGK